MTKKRLYVVDYYGRRRRPSLAARILRALGVRW